MREISAALVLWTACLGPLVAALALPPVAAMAAEPPQRSITFSDAPRVLFDPAVNGCDGNDVPDAPARVVRGADGMLTLFGLHYTNHALRGPSLDRLRIDCRSALPSHGNGDPAAYDDMSWITATWTTGGSVVDALVHHEFRADSHPGRCRFASYMECWFNTVLAARSTDGGKTFSKLPDPVVASAPFDQSSEQGRHRGFFNPSNIVSDGRTFSFLASTTGWDGQDAGVCLFRSADPDRPGSWRAFDGTGFTIAYVDPYSAPVIAPARPCKTIAPFPAPVGSVIQTVDGLWLAVFQAQRDSGFYAVSGFYYVTSRDLLAWSSPRLLLAGTTNYEDPCGSGGSLIAYPSLVDPASGSRNFDRADDTAVLLYADMKVDGCAITADRKLMARPVRIGPGQ